MSDELSVIILAVLLVSGLAIGLCTIWFLQKKCVKSCRISQTVFASIGAIACLTFLATNAPNYDWSLGSWISIGIPESLQISLRFRLDKIAATTLLIVYSSIAVVVAMPWKAPCPYSQDERSLVAGSAAGLSAGTLLFLAGDLYLLLFAWIGLGGAAFLLCQMPSHQNDESQQSQSLLNLFSSEFICVAGFFLSVSILGSSLRALELPEVLALSTLESLYPDNYAMIDMIGLGAVITVLVRSVQFPFFAPLPVFSGIELRRFWLILFTTVIPPSVFLALKFFQVWRPGSVIPDLISTIGIISVIYYGLLSVVTPRFSTRVVALSLMPIGLFWAACGFQSFTVLVVAVCFVLVVVTSVVLFSTELVHNSKPSFSLIGFVVALILLLVLWTFLKVMHTGRVQMIDEFDAAMSSGLFLAVAGLTQLWLQSRETNVVDTASSPQSNNGKNDVLVQGLEPVRIVVFAFIATIGVGLPIVLNGVGDGNPMTQSEVRGILWSGILFLIPLSVIAVASGGGVGWWLHKNAGFSSNPSSGPVGSLARVVQQHLYIPKVVELLVKLDSILLGPAILILESRLLLNWPKRVIFESGRQIRLAIERIFFSEESLLIAAAVMSIAILSATLLW